MGKAWAALAGGSGAAAGMPYMRIIYDLTKRTGVLESLVGVLQRELRKMQAQPQACVAQELPHTNTFFNGHILVLQ